MTHARQEAEWNRTAALMALTANMHSARRHSPDDFNPFARRHRSPVPASMKELRQQLMSGLH